MRPEEAAALHEAPTLMGAIFDYKKMKQRREKAAGPHIPPSRPTLIRQRAGKIGRYCVAWYGKRATVPTCRRDLGRRTHNPTNDDGRPKEANNDVLFRELTLLPPAPPPRPERRSETEKKRGQEGNIG